MMNPTSRTNLLKANEMTEEKTSSQVELKDSERQPCEIWTRVMGYHRPVQSFNIGKKGEFKERVYFTEQSAKAHGSLGEPCCAKKSA